MAGGRPDDRSLTGTSQPIVRVSSVRTTGCLVRRRCTTARRSRLPKPRCVPAEDTYCCRARRAVSSPGGRQFGATRQKRPGAGVTGESGRADGGLFTPLFSASVSVSTGWTSSGFPSPLRETMRGPDGLSALGTGGGQTVTDRECCYDGDRCCIVASSARGGAGCLSPQRRTSARSCSGSLTRAAPRVGCARATAQLAQAAKRSRRWRRRLAPGTTPARRAGGENAGRRASLTSRWTISRCPPSCRSAVPAKLVRQRPDVQAAEAQLAPGHRGRGPGDREPVTAD